MEDPERLLRQVLAFARDHEGILAVVRTGSRGRGQRVDRLSDLDIELIGPGTADLVDDDEWPTGIAEVLVSIHLANDGQEEPDWPTCLVVFAEGRKVDFTLAGNARVERMCRDGLDDLYQRGYQVCLDKTGITRWLPAAPDHPPARPLPSAYEFDTNQREFWFEATQVPVYLARGDLWPSSLRQAEMRALLLTMLEWNTRARTSRTVDTGYSGHRIGEWLGEAHRVRLPEVHAGYDAPDMLRALHALVDFYDDVSRETAYLLSHAHRDLRASVEAHIDSVLRTKL